MTYQRIPLATSWRNNSTLTCQKERKKCKRKRLTLIWFSASIQFSVLRGSDLEKMSDVPISTRTMYSRHDNVTPMKNGVLYSRLGTNEKNGSCGTCNQGMTECPGHFGFLKLALPIFHVGYFKHTVAILQCICKTCSRVLLNEEDRQRHLRKTSVNREPSQNLKILKAIIDDCKKMHTCCYCGAYNGTVKKKPGEALKILHERFKVSKDNDMEELINQFTHSCNVNPEFERYIRDFCEDLDPLKTQ